jgi:hypothetical protein
VTNSEWFRPPAVQGRDELERAHRRCVYEEAVMLLQIKFHYPKRSQKKKKKEAVERLVNDEFVSLVGFGFDTLLHA